MENTIVFPAARVILDQPQLATIQGDPPNVGHLTKRARIITVNGQIWERTWYLTVGEKEILENWNRGDEISQWKRTGEERRVIR